MWGERNLLCFAHKKGLTSISGSGPITKWGLWAVTNPNYFWTLISTVIQKLINHSHQAEQEIKNFQYLDVTLRWTQNGMHSRYPKLEQSACGIWLRQVTTSQRGPHLRLRSHCKRSGSDHIRTESCRPADRNQLIYFYQVLPSWKHLLFGHNLHTHKRKQNDYALLLPCSGGVIGENQTVLFAPTWSVGQRSDLFWDASNVATYVKRLFSSGRLERLRLDMFRLDSLPMWPLP
jgi:hypothetical protein